ncbi:NAD-dependent epimerase/dehydratase family protein [Jeotgalibacillus sp. S-D1]|uniref:NAD-dependent epimerase/dehydratase family protein n=1 Tax=Jeotgalibacillus sp. S-D1 TaxID=2552189 RepID=UPI001059F426|nr:NAD-dependent epimerase/dehydratase family protein [Jeotgalibacillus sp. S-D1]TDL32674.1 NAD-dependent epimerase/dehydratase family protein [Jeotgalibacillus sp. S-D1]
MFGNVLVTGGAGFLGSQLVKALIPKSDHIYILDNLSTGTKAAVPATNKITFYENCITDEAVLNKILPKVDYIFHFACKNLVLSVHNIYADFHTNVFGGFTLLRKAKELSPHLKRFVYASTASVYGDAEILPTPESYYNIKLPYSASKFTTEHYCDVYFNMYQMPVTTLRFSNVYGPGQLISNPYCGVVAKFFDSAKNGLPYQIFGDGKQTRDFTYVEDAIDATILTAVSDAALGQKYNVGTGKETNILQLASSIKQVTGTQALTNDFYPERNVDVVQRRSMKTAKIKQELNWINKHTLTEGLEKTKQWLKEM